MNLCTNAHHAMGERGGRLELELRQLAAGSEAVANAPAAESGRLIELTVTDNGEGIDKKHLERIFEPFYTTKAEGDGTGMGLAVVYGIVREHGGTIGVQSTRGVGTTFRILLPALASAAAADNKLDPATIEGQGHIFLVDDEEMIVDMASRMLTRIGYRVTSFTNPWRALEAFENAPSAVDILITDFTMPNLTGMELARRFIAKQPGLPVIINTGNLMNIDEAEVDALGSVAVALKPYDLQQLSRLVHDCLQRKDQ